jgi:hypothetical protein
MFWDSDKAKRKNSLFDNIEIFGKTLPEILRESGVPDPIIDEFRNDFNSEKESPEITDEDVKWRVEKSENFEFKESDTIKKLKSELDKGYVPPEERHYDYYEK